MSSKRRQCQNHPDVFCYICGECKLVKYRFNVRDFTKRAYEAYFGIKLGDQDKSWAPHKVCRQCTETLRCWTQGKATSMRFRVFMVWREPKTHHEDSYFCIVDMTGWNQQKKKDWYYPDIESARRPVPHCTEVPVPVFTFFPDFTADEALLEAMEDTSNSCSKHSSTSMTAEASSLSTNPKPVSQGQLNDLVRDLNLSKESSELSASRLGEHGVLDSGTKITFYCNRDDLLLRFFTMEDDFVFCNNIPGLLAEMGLSKYNSDQGCREPRVGLGTTQILRFSGFVQSKTRRKSGTLFSGFSGDLKKKRKTTEIEMVFLTKIRCDLQKKKGLRCSISMGPGVIVPPAPLLEALIQMNGDCSLTAPNVV